MPSVLWRIDGLVGSRLLAPVAAAMLGLPAAGDDHGDTLLTSTPIEYGVRVAGTIDSATDVDIFRIDLHAQATLDMRSGGRLDTVGTLYDGSGATIATDDDSGSGMNFRLRETLGGGVHYLAVQSDVDTGDYRLIVRIERADDHGNTSATSTLLPPGVSVAGAIGADDDVDVFRIDVNVPSHLTVATGGPADTTGELRDGSDRVLVTADEGGSRANFRIERNVQTGPHYLHVTADQASAYYIEANLQALEEGDPGGTDQEDPDVTHGSAAALFGAAISQQIVQARCIRCHVAGGESGNTRLVFVSSIEQDHEASNLGVLRAFVFEAGDGDSADNAMLVLDKMSASVSHGGGVQVQGGSEDYLNMEALLARIVAEGSELGAGKAVADQTVEAGKELRITIAGGPLDVLSSDTCVATATVEGDGVLLTGHIAGTTAVSVTTDSSTEATTFQLDVQPPSVPDWALPRGVPDNQDVTPAPWPAFSTSYTRTLRCSPRYSFAAAKSSANATPTAMTSRASARVGPLPRAFTAPPSAPPSTTATSPRWNRKPATS